MQRFTRPLKRFAAVLALLACVGSMAIAQAPPGLFKIYQNGVEVGEIYTPQCASRSLYVEHWILYPNYVYPNARNGIKTEIVPDADASYASEADFFARAPFGPGYRYVHVTSEDGTQLPRP